MRPRRYIASKRKGSPQRIGDKDGLHNHYIAVCNSVQQEEDQQGSDSHDRGYDSDSYELAIDDCATSSITNCVDDFVDVPAKVRRKVQGIGGFANNILQGTIRWRIEDDDGRVHEVLLPNTLYIPSSPRRLLCPHHWAQHLNDNFPDRHGTGCTTYDDVCVLFWNQQKFKRTIKWDKRTNIAIIRSAPGFKKYSVYAAAIDEEQRFECYHVRMLIDDRPSLLIPDNPEQSEEGLYRPELQDGVREASVRTTEDLLQEQLKPLQFGTKDSLRGPRATPAQAIPAEFGTKDDLQGPRAIPETAMIEDDRELVYDDPQAELLRWHHRLGHLSFTTIKAMALANLLPRKLANCQSPKCAGCLFGRATRRPWRTKATPNKIQAPVIAAPGDCISVDQLESTSPGLIAQLKGRMTKARYHVATIFTDHHSDLSFVYLQRQATSEETVQAKQAFEKYARQCGVIVKHYHADNGRFADNAFIEACNQAGQTISYCGVNAHFQNGVAEKRIRDLQDQARTMMLHAKARWPQAISVNLWPYALRMANDVRNSTPGR